VGEEQEYNSEVFGTLKPVSNFVVSSVFELFLTY
jgi:hypothetical protein